MLYLHYFIVIFIINYFIATIIVTTAIVVIILCSKKTYFSCHYLKCFPKIIFSTIILYFINFHHRCLKYFDLMRPLTLFFVDLHDGQN